jgi:hypothetical protein
MTATSTEPSPVRPAYTRLPLGLMASAVTLNANGYIAMTVLVLVSITDTASKSVVVLLT